MKTRSVFASVMLSVCMLQGCSDPTEDIVIRANPAPVQGYMISLDASEVPGPIDIVNLYASYESAWSGEPCLPEAVPPIERRMPWKSIDVPMTSLGGNKFEGKVYLDALQDEAYFNRGNCVWRLNTAGVQFKGRGGKIFGTGIGYTELKPGARGVAYYPISEWTDSSPSPDRVVAAMSIATNHVRDNPERFANKQEYFTIVLAATPLPGSKGLTVAEEFKQRTGQDMEQ